MRRRMSITLDEVVYEGLYRTVGKRQMSQFFEDLLRPLVTETALDDGYRAMAADQQHGLPKSGRGSVSVKRYLFVFPVAWQPD